MNKKKVYFIVAVLALLLILNKLAQKTYNVNELTKPKHYTFNERLEVLKYEKKLACESYEPCDAAFRDGRVYSNPQNTLNICQASLYSLENSSYPSTMASVVQGKFDFIKIIFVFKTKKYIQEAKKIIKENGHPPGIIINLAPLFEPKNCDAYSVFDEINNNYDLRKVMYDENSKSYYYINCNNLSTDDLESLLMKYDNQDKK